MLTKINRYYHTLKYLKWIQIKYQLIYRIKKNKMKVSFDLANRKPYTALLKMQQSINSLPSYSAEDTFSFLNLTQHFDSGINWNYPQNGKLWVYNLNYFEFLSQPEMSKKDGCRLIFDFIKKQESNTEGMEAFPISLRVISWIKFIIKHQIKDKKIEHSLFCQLQYLKLYPEFHLLGNHLLENAFALLFGGYYFNDSHCLDLARKILDAQLNEQILSDGGHFELSPMYHQIMLFRVLDSINLLQHNPNKQDDDLLKSMREKAKIMLSWMSQLTFSNGNMAYVNDSAPGIAPVAIDLLEYAKCLKIQPANIPLAESGYRKFLKSNYEILIDIGNIGPTYIPGHAHSDTFNFILYHKDLPLIVDTGISTYEKNIRRNLERSTLSHNTVMVNKKEQSTVWGGFRVAQRAKVFDLHESNDYIQASHDGYKRISTIHQRTFDLNKHSICITDSLSSQKPVKAFFHFHPDVKVKLSHNEVHGDFGKITFSNAIDIQLVPYSHTHGFNQIQKAQKVKVSFKKTLQTKIILN